MPTFVYDGRPAFMYDEESDQWLQIGGAIDTSAGYTWTGTNAFSNDVTFSDAVKSVEGINNFLNPAARDAAIPSPVHGTVAFVRQNSGGTTINQWQYYDGSAWVANDGDISAVTAGTGLSGGGSAGAVTLSVDTTFVATTSNTMTMSNKTLASPVVTTALTLNAAGEIRFADTDSSNYVGFKSPSTVSTNYIWTLPSADGSSGQFLKTNGSSTLSWSSVTTDPTPTVFLLMGA